MNQSVKHEAPSDTTTAHNVRSSQLTVMPHYWLISREEPKRHADEEKIRRKKR